MGAAKRILIAAILLALTPGARAGAATIAVYGTGINAAGTGLAADSTVDQHYTLNGGAAYISNETKQPINETGGYAWTPDTSTSKWISPNADPDTSEPVTTFNYQTTFNLTGFNLSSVVLTGNFAADDSTAIEVNGVVVDSQFGQYQSMTAFTLTDANNIFVNGVNTIDFVVDNSGGGPSGLQVQLSGVGSIQQTPEPGFLSLLGGVAAPAAAMAIRNRRRRA